MRHKHADQIHAWAEGAEIEYFSPDDNWHPVDASVEDWRRNNYRIKPEKKPDVIKHYKADFSGSISSCDFRLGCNLDNLRLTFSGETGKLIKAEVL